MDQLGLLKGQGLFRDEVKQGVSEHYDDEIATLRTYNLGQGRQDSLQFDNQHCW